MSNAIDKMKGVPTIGMIKCRCVYATCKIWHLTGIGKFYTGSGFTEEEAKEIVASVNSLRYLRRLQTELHLDPHEEEIR